MNRRSVLLVSCAVLFSVVFQASVLPIHVDNSFKPDLLLIIMVYLALRGSFELGIPTSWLLGLLKDLFSGLYLGLNAFSFLLVFLVIKSVADRLYAESGFLFVVTVVVATLVTVTANLLLLLMFTPNPGIAYSIVAGLIPNLLVNSFAASLVALLPTFSRDQDIA